MSPEKERSRREAIMLLNHKEALKFILQEPDYLKTLTVSHIEDIHSILTENLNVDRNIRSRRLGITGTNYRPLDNKFQIRKAMQDTCKLINAKSCVFEKALLALSILSITKKQCLFSMNKITFLLLREYLWNNSSLW
jgi:fic protein